MHDQKNDSLILYFLSVGLDSYTFTKDNNDVPYHKVRNEDEDANVDAHTRCELVDFLEVFARLDELLLFFTFNFIVIILDEVAVAGELPLQLFKVLDVVVVQVLFVLLEVLLDRLELLVGSPEELKLMAFVLVNQRLADMDRAFEQVLSILADDFESIVNDGYHCDKEQDLESGPDKALDLLRP